MRRFAPIILVVLIAAGVVLLTTTTRRPQATPETPSSATLFPGLAGNELRKALHDYAAAGHDRPPGHESCRTGPGRPSVDTNVHRAPHPRPAPLRFPVQS